MPAMIPPLWLDEDLVTDDLQGQLLDLGPASTQAESIDRIASLQRLIATASSVLAAEEARSPPPRSSVNSTPG